MAEVNMPQGDDIRPVANGYRKKAGLDKKIRNLFGSESAGAVADDIFNRTIVPGIKGMFLQALHGFVDGMFGGSNTRYYGGYNNYGPRYDSYSEPSYRRGRDYSGYSRGSYGRDYYDERGYRQQRRRTDDEMAFHSWLDADRVKDTLAEMIERKGYVTISQFNYICKLPDKDYMDGRWGWYDISSANIYTARGFFGPGDDGYILDLPEPVYIEGLH